MSKSRADSLGAGMLAAIGFKPEDRQSWTLWRYAIPRAADRPDVTGKNRAAPKPVFPWSLQSLEVAERKSGLTLNHVSLTLDRAQLLKNLRVVTRKYFGLRASPEFSVNKDGCIWCLFEFVRPTTAKDSGKDRDERSHSLPHGVGGFSVRVTAGGASLEVVVADYFGIGYVPPNFASIAVKYAVDALGLKTFLEALGAEVKQTSIFEASCPAFEPALAWLAEQVGNLAIKPLREALVNAKSTITLGVQPSEHGYRVEAPCGYEGQGQALASLMRVPLEVLEARERTSRSFEVDTLVRQGKTNKALKAVVQALQSDVNDLYMARRLSLIGLAGKVEERAPAMAALAKALEREPNNKLLLSFGVAMALESDDKSKLLSLLSRLGAELMTAIDRADDLRSLDVVLPELLGDAWRGEDSHKAEECYQRVIQRRGDLPRVLRKIIDITRVAERPEAEILYLNRLAAVERRRIELSRIHLRLAELRRLSSLGREEAIELALKALSLDRSNDRAARLSAELLVERARPEEAIQLLDGVLRDPSLAMTARAKASLEADVARIWRGPMRRADLAEARFEQARRYDPSDLRVLKDLESLYRESGRVGGLAELLEAQFQAHEANGDGAGLRGVFDELVTLYRGPLKQPKRAFELYQRVIVMSVEPHEIDKVMAWSDIEIDWRDLYGRLLQKLPRTESGERRAQYQCRLGEICRERLRDEAAALQHFMGALSEGWIDASAFTFVVEALSKSKDYAALARCYEDRIEMVAGADRRHLIAELLQVPEVLSDPKRDSLAVQAYGLDATFERPLLQRFAHYRDVDDTDGIERLAQALLSDRSVSTMAREKWIRHAIDVLEGCIDERRFMQIDGLFRQLLDLALDRVPTLQSALAALKGGEASRLIPYSVMLLDQGYLPNLEEKVVVRLLSGMTRELALFHQLMSLKANQPEIAAQHARTAAALYASRHGEEKNTEAMLGRAFSLVPCADEDIVTLARLVERSQNWALLTRVLQKQADAEDEKQRKFILLDRLGQIQWKKQKDIARARLTFVIALKVAPHPFRVKLVLAHLAREANDQKGEQKSLADFLLDPQCVNDTRAMTYAVQRQLALGEDGKFLQRAVQGYLDAATANGQFELAGRLSSVLLDNGIASVDLYKSAFKAAVSGRQTERAVDLWWRGLASVANKTAAKAYIAETRLVLEREERKILLLDCFQAALQNDIASRVGPKINREVLILYGALLFDSDTKRRKALDIYVEAFAADPDDNRSWMPLYFLLLEFGSPEQRLFHLRAIIPKLDQDPRPLKAFPITIESLKVELQELEEQLKDVLPELKSVAVAPTVEKPKAPPPDGEAPVAAMSRVAGEADDFSGLPPLFTNSSATSEASQLRLRLAEPPQKREPEVIVPIIDPAPPVENRAFSPRAPEIPVPELRVEPTPVLPDLSTFQPTAEPLPQDALGDLGNLSLSLDEHPVSPPSDEPVLQIDMPMAQGVMPKMDINAEPPLLPLENLDSPPDMSISEPPRVELEAPESNLDLGNFSLGALDMAAPPEPESAALPSLGMPPLPKAKVGGSFDEQSSLANAVVSLGDLPELGVVSSVELAAAVDLPSVPSLQNAIPAEALPPPPPLESSFSDGGSTEVLQSSNPIAAPGTSATGTGASGMGSALGSGMGGDMGAFGAAVGEGPYDVADWRAAVIKGDFNADLTNVLLTQAFASEIEKHLAIQAVSVVAGTCDRLANWHWRVWRNAEEFGYPLSGKERYPEGISPQILQTSLNKLMITVAPLFVKIFRERFTIEYLARRLMVNAAMVEKARKPLSWTEGLLPKVGFKMYAQRIAERRYLAFNLPGLGKEIFYEGGTRAIYFDEAHYKSAPPSHLFHRILGLLWSVRIHYFVPLALHPQKQIFPLLSELHQYLGLQGFSRIKTRLKARSNLSKYLQGVDTRQIKALYEKVGMPTEDQVTQLWEAMRTHIYRLLAAETLDVVGLFESILDRDLLKPGTIKHSQVYELTPYAKGLIEFVTKLKI